MQTIKQVALSLLLIGLCAGCATMSKNECLEADWYQIGYRDGAVGTPRAQLQRHMDACTEHGIRADRNAYFRGRDEGLRGYCTEESGYEQGKMGRAYRGVCPPELESAFLNAYRSGLEIHRYNAAVDKLQRQLSAIEMQIAQKEDLVYTDDLSKERRLELRYEIKELELKHLEAQTKLRELEQHHLENVAASP
jgi:hypothetical protein